MTCPVCGGKTHITNSRPKNDTVYRRRECDSCGYRFNTYEYEEDFTKQNSRKGNKKCRTAKN